MHLPEKGLLLRIFIGESDRYEGIHRVCPARPPKLHPPSHPRPAGRTFHSHTCQAAPYPVNHDYLALSYAAVQ
jgi:hypothetical protein